MSKTTPEEAIAIGEKYSSACIRREGHVVYFEITPEKLAALIDEVRGVDAEPVAWVLFRRDEDGLEPIQLYGGAEKPDGEFKDRFVLRAVYFRPAPSQPAAPVELPVVADTRRLDAFTPGLELSFDYGDEDEEGLWCVHRVHGSVNDREWTLIGKGRTVRQAIDDAQAAITAWRKAS